MDGGLLTEGEGEGRAVTVGLGEDVGIVDGETVTLGRADGSVERKYEKQILRNLDRPRILLLTRRQHHRRTQRSRRNEHLN